MSGKGGNSSGGLSGRGGLVLGFEAKVLGELRLEGRCSKLEHSNNKGLGLDWGEGMRGGREGWSWGSEIPKQAEKCWREKVRLAGAGRGLGR